jgi:phosphatidylglycerol:prolipoprotein diacylglycerol transferase
MGGFIGARLYHVASSWQYYAEYPFDALKVWHGGLSIFGALIGGFIVLVLFAKRLKTPLFRLLDWLAPSVVLGQIIGRFGNFFNYEAFGYPTNVLWKMFVPEMFRPAELMGAEYFHPLFLYEALGNCLVLYILLKYSKKAPAGGLFFGYLFLYNILRFALEHLRVDSIFLWGGVRLNAVVSALLCLVGAAGYYYVHNKTSQTTTAQMEKS